MAGKFNDVAALFDLERRGDNLFRSGAPQAGFGRVFGGQVIAQTLIAACRTVEGRMPHSLHAYFILPGAIEEPIDFEVDRLRDGRSFTTRRVVAHQAAEAIFSLEVSFTRPEDGIAHQDPMPAVPGPDGLPDWEVVRPDRPPGAAHRSDRSPIEIRSCATGGEPGVGPIVRQV